LEFLAIGSAQEKNDPEQQAKARQQQANHLRRAAAAAVKLFLDMAERKGIFQITASESK
jgi:hypothetical protein